MSDHRPSELTQAIDDLSAALSTWSAAVGGAASSQAAAVFVKLYEKVEALEARVTELERLKERERGA